MKIQYFVIFDYRLEFCKYNWMAFEDVYWRELNHQGNGGISGYGQNRYYSFFINLKNGDGFGEGRGKSFIDDKLELRYKDYE